MLFVIFMFYAEHLSTLPKTNHYFFVRSTKTLVGVKLVTRLLISLEWRMHILLLFYILISWFRVMLYDHYFQMIFIVIHIWLCWILVSFWYKILTYIWMDWHFDYQPTKNEWRKRNMIVDMIFALRFFIGVLPPNIKSEIIKNYLQLSHLRTNLTSAFKDYS